MKLREIALIVGGLVIGLAVGVVLIGSNDSLRKTLFATTADIEMSYYAVDVQTLHDWLLGSSTDAQLQTAFDQVSGLATTDNFRTAVQGAQGSITLVLDRSLTKLLGSTTPPDTVACLGLNDLPSLPQTVVEFYIAVPAAQASSIIPSSWSPALSQPKPDDLYWESIGCHPVTTP